MIRPNDISKQRVNKVMPHEFRDLFGIILTAPQFGYGGSFLC